jgi:hypothetical protein
MTTAEVISIVLAGARLLKKPAEDAVSAACKDAYEKAKEYLRRKFSSSNDATTALDQAEQKPDSKAREAVLVEEAQPFRIEHDKELLHLVKHLREVLGNCPSLVQQHVNVTQAGNNNSFVMAGRDVIQPQHHTVRNVVKPDETHVSAEQKKTIKDLVDELAIRLAGEDGNPNYRAAWGRLYDEFKITSYHLLPACDFERALSFLREQKAISRSRLRRRNPQVYRNDFYAKIFSSAKTLGWADEQIYAFAEEKLETAPIKSLRKLGPNQLKKVAECISRKADSIACG